MDIVPLNSVHLDPSNVRKHNERNLETIAASLQRFGQQKPIVVDAKGIIRAGNGTYAAAKSLGWKEIGIVRTKLEGAEAIAYAIADNRTAELAEWDIADLSAHWQSLDEDLQKVTGFAEEDMAALLATITPPTFLPVGEDEQGRLDQKAPTICPKCGHEWTV